MTSNFEIAQELYEHLSAPITLGGVGWLALPKGTRDKWTEIVQQVRKRIEPRKADRDGALTEILANGARVKLIMPEGQLEINGTLVPTIFTPTQRMMLECLMSRFPRVQTRDQLLDYAWRDSSSVDDRIVDSMIKRIRVEFRRFPGLPLAVETHYGAGYKLVIKQIPGPMVSRGESK